MPSNVPGMSAGLGDEMSSIPLGKIIGGPLMATVKAQGAAADSTVRFLQESCMDDYTDAPSWRDLGTNPIPFNELYPLERILDLMPHGFIPGKPNKGILPNGHYPMSQVVRHNIDGVDRFFVAKSSVNSSIEPGVALGWETSWREVSKLNVRTINFAYDQQVQTETGTSYNNHNVTIPLMAMVPIPYLRIDTMDLDFSVKLTGVEKTAQVDRFSAKARAGYGGKRFGVTAAFAHRSSKGQSKQISRSYSLQVKVRASQGEMPVGVERMINLMDNLITDDIAEIED